MCYFRRAPRRPDVRAARMNMEEVLRIVREEEGGSKALIGANAGEAMML